MGNWYPKRILIQYQICMRQITEERLLKDMINLLENCITSQLNEFEEMTSKE